MALIHRDTDYAVRALLKLMTSDEVVSVAVLAESTDVPPEFLRKIMQKLHGASILRSRQGPSGGYALSKEPGDVNLLELVRVVQGPLAVNECFVHPECCPSSPACALKRELHALQARIENSLKEITLARIAAGTADGQAAGQG